MGSVDMHSHAGAWERGNRDLALIRDIKAKARKDCKILQELKNTNSQCKMTQNFLREVNWRVYLPPKCRCKEGASTAFWGLI